MKIVKEHPPNFADISRILHPPPTAVFPYGDTIYAPQGGDIPADILFHETIHQKQQGDNPEKWWAHYLYDKDFRYQQELEAYAKQYHFVCEHFPAKAKKECLAELAHELSTHYALDISYFSAHTSIRKYANERM
jgi:hypothetical protein